MATSPSPNTTEFWQTYMENEVPLSRAMELKVLELTPEVRLAAPLRPNQNNKGTAFAGSLSSALALGGWICTQHWMDPTIEDYDVVLYHSDITFGRPVTGDFEIRAQLQPAPDLSKVQQLLKRSKKARVTVEAAVLQSGEKKASFKGSYVILEK